MLLSLDIQNIALIKKLSVEFSEGLNVLSGETGAGKSIIIDSINFILGGRADKTLIRYGENSALVEAVFEYAESNESVRAFFEENGIETDDNIILRRVMTADNKNECRINGRLVNLFVLKGLTSLLADVCGQHEHQSLLKIPAHIAVIDGLSIETAAAKKEVKGIYEEYTAVAGRLDSFGDTAYRERRLDILEFQIDEIERAAIKDGEEEQLKDERVRLNNMGKLTSSVSAAYDAVDGGEITAASLIASAFRHMTAAGEYDKSAADIAERLSDIKSQLGDIIYDTKGCLDGLNYDEKYADAIESRWDEIKLVKKKYGQTLEAVAAHLIKLKEEYDSLKDSENILAKLTHKKEELYDKYERTALNLSALRRKTAQKFECDIKRELAELGMAGTTFQVFFADVTASGYKAANMRKDGIDKIEFLISPNAGEPLKPLSKIISGGEMSRFMLALKTIISGADNIDTVIFDEIDSGISGRVAETVAEKLSGISLRRQVLAVTHLAQLASFADRHFLISKSVSDNKTLTAVQKLSYQESVAEIARLTGGSDTSLAIPHARNIKEKADAYKLTRKG
ncbi:MAG: DNA repair protein RecN [Clostridiales bacterium]|jgi:DNA repair protein RecN (Recombination protein N)|nr:DNA repair protein RecN [Clostridiales bacterium]